MRFGSCSNVVHPEIMRSVMSLAKKIGANQVDHEYLNLFVNIRDKELDCGTFSIEKMNT